MFGDKDSSKFETLAVSALTSDTNIQDKVHEASNTHRRLVKAGGSGTNFKAKGKDLFKYATYFQE